MQYTLLKLKNAGLYALVLAMVFVLAGCAQTAEVAAPEAQLAASVPDISIIETDRIYDNISVNGINIGGLTKEEALEKLSDELYSPLENQKIIVKSGERTWPLELNNLGYNYDIKKAVDEAYGIARTGSNQERHDRITELEKAPYDIEITPKYNAGIIDGFLEEIAREVDAQPVEPIIGRENNEFQITPGEDGKKVDTVKAKADIVILADAMEGGEVALAMETVHPRFTEEDLQNARSLIGAFSTPITGSASRDVNLTVASGYINGITLYPEDVFSTNATIGPTTYERGYRVAPVIENGRLVDGMGGGVCQVSSTLYNAVLFSELEIVQRRNHSLVVGYVAIGRDATLAGDVIDFQFKNNTEYPIYIESYLEGKRLHVNIYGHESRPENRTLDFESVWVSSTPAPAEKEISDPELPLGERVVEVASLGGSVVDVYKKVFVDGVMTERIYVDRSTYRARAGEARVGTGEAVPVQEPLPEVPPAAEPEPVPDSTVPEWIDTRPQDFMPADDEPWTPIDFM